ncbi:MAG: helix-turn-helix protein [Alphaproteobacteria bacterium]|jgi:DNA-binding Xre family transcriptional regulator|nr:helix-turn-helix protein [Alphaproteobacteria bacterium]MDF3034101.1 helix-turn-helix protein [Alphaproteobacteria bacterium]
MNFLSLQIKEKMAEQRISAHALEKKASLKASAVQNILYGRSKNPSIYTLQAIARALNCQVHDLIGGDQENNSLPYDTLPEPSSEKHASPWDIELYSKCLECLTKILKSKKTTFSKEKVLDLVQEIYLYSQKGYQHEPDIRFTEWIVEKNLR